MNPVLIDPGLYADHAIKIYCWLTTLQTISTFNTNGTIETENQETAWTDVYREVSLVNIAYALTAIKVCGDVEDIKTMC